MISTGNTPQPLLCKVSDLICMIVQWTLITVKSRGLLQNFIPREVSSDTVIICNAIEIHENLTICHEMLFLFTPHMHDSSMNLPQLGGSAL